MYCILIKANGLVGMLSSWEYSEFSEAHQAAVALVAALTNTDNSTHRVAVYFPGFGEYSVSFGEICAGPGAIGLLPFDGTQKDEEDFLNNNFGQEISRINNILQALGRPHPYTAKDLYDDFKSQRRPEMQSYKRLHTAIQRP